MVSLKRKKPQSDGLIPQSIQKSVTMDGFTRRKEQSKEEIRKAAWDLFSQFGVEKVSVADIARKAGVSQATIYNNFGSKEMLAREFVTTVVEQLVNRVQEILTPNMHYWEKMAAFIQFISEIMAHERPSVADNTIFTSSFDLQNDPEIKKIRDSAQAKMTDLLLGLVQEGKNQGQINLNLSEEALGIYFKVFMDIFTAPQLQHRFSHDPKLVLDVGSLMIYGLSGQHK
jgi:AcrR family transcriptional regulator